MSLDSEMDFALENFRVYWSCLPDDLSDDGKKALLARYRVILDKMLRREATAEECAEVGRFLDRVTDAFSAKAQGQWQCVEPEAP